MPQNQSINLRERVGRYLLKKGLRNNTQSRKMISLRRASSVGILFEMDSVQTYQVIHDYIQALQKAKIKVKAIGYAADERITKQLLQVLSFDFFFRKNLNWYFRPRAQCTDDFVNSEFDICINLGRAGFLPLSFLASRVKASLRVGVYSESDVDIYDVMIHSGKVHDQKKFLKDVHDYLTILNPKEDA